MSDLKKRKIFNRENLQSNKKDDISYIKNKKNNTKTDLSNNKYYTKVINSSSKKNQNINSQSINSDNLQSQETLIRVKKKYPYFKRHKGQKRALIVLGAIILAFLVLWLIGFFGMHSGSPDDPGKEIWYKDHKYVYNESVISTLVIGYDQTEQDMNNGKAGQVDYLMLMALDVDNNRLRAISIPRDCMVEMAEYVGDAFVGMHDNKQIALTYSYGDGKEKSCEYTKNAVSRLLYNMPINKYFSLNIDGIGPLADSIGGVNLKVKETLPNTNIVEGKNIILMGDNAKKYVKWRGQDINASERRRQRDVQFMEEWYKQAFRKVSTNTGKAFDIYNVGTKYAISNYGIPDFVYFGTLALSVNINSFDTLHLKGEIKRGESFVEFWPDQTNVFETVLDVFYNMVE